MFNVSVLLLHDTLKLVMSLTNGTINQTLHFCFHKTKDSVATHLFCGGIFNDIVITNSLLILTVKEI